MTTRRQPYVHMTRNSLIPKILQNVKPECVICTSDFSNKNGLITVFPCQHIFHTNCTLFYPEGECPQCKRSFEFERFGHKKMKSKKKKQKSKKF